MHENISIIIIITIIFFIIIIIIIMCHLVMRKVDMSCSSIYHDLQPFFLFPYTHPDFSKTLCHQTTLSLSNFCLAAAHFPSSITNANTTYSTKTSHTTSEAVSHCLSTSLIGWNGQVDVT